MPTTARPMSADRRVELRGRTRSAAPPTGQLAGRWAVAILLLGGSANVLTAAGPQPPAIFHSFDGPAVTWQWTNSRRDVELLGHGCVGDDAREGTGSERIVLAAPGGESVQLAVPVGRIAVLDELESRLWVKANRPGVRLAARVVLPRSIDTRTGLPRTAIVQGTQYEQAGRWQQLSLAKVPELLASRVRVMRTAPGNGLDPREAYVDAMLLIVPGGPGGTAVWTDALEVDGVVLSPPVGGEQAGSAIGVVPADQRVPAAETHSWHPDSVATVGNGIQPAAIRLRGTALTVSGKQYLSVGIEWNAEPLDFLADRGFNTVWTRQPPTIDETNAATRADVWFVCPPPGPDAIANGGLAVPLDRVLAWYLGQPAENELDYYQRWAELVRRNDPRPGRPIIVAPQGDWLPYSRVADILLAAHPASSQLSATEYAEWLAGIAQLARPGTPFWALLPTQPGKRARRQAAALLPDQPLSAIVRESQLESLLRTAGTSGCRGFLFQSHASLHVANELSRRRADALELLNRELHLIDPWLTIGKNVGQVVSSDATTSAHVLQVERARLVVPMPHSADAHATAADRANREYVLSESGVGTALVVPGVPSSNDAYLLTPAGIRRLATKRVAGGMRVVVDREMAGMVLMTEDPTVVGSIRQRVARAGRRAAVLERDLAAALAKAIPETGRLIGQRGAETGELFEAARIAGGAIDRCNTQLAAGNFDGAFRLARAARRAIEASTDRQRRRLTASPQLFSTPFGRTLGTLREQAELLHRLESLRPGDNLLYGGDFEEMNRLTQFGWRHISRPLPGVEPRAELSAVEPYLGKYSLQLTAVAAPIGTAPSVVARPLVWITSPPVHVTKGQVLEISGWVRVPEPIVGSIHGLEIIDSLGGPELSVRVRESHEWQPFRMIRGVPATTDMTVTFALSGTGTALVDAVMIRPLTHATARRLPTVSESAESADPRAATLPQPLFSPPGRR